MNCSKCTVHRAKQGSSLCEACQYDMPPEDPDYDDWDDDPDNDPEHPDYWECYGCMKTFGRKQMGNQCPNCGSILDEGYF